MKVITIGKPGGHRFNVTPYVDLCSHKSLQLLSAHLQAQGARPNVTLASRPNSPMQMADSRAWSAWLCGWMSRWASPGLSDAARQLLAEHPQIDALLVLVDVLAVGVMQHVQQFGLRMPQDIKISTRYDGMRARTCEPA